MSLKSIRAIALMHYLVVNTYKITKHGGEDEFGKYF